MLMAFLFCGLLNAALASINVSDKRYGWATWYALCAIASFMGLVR